MTGHVDEMERKYYRREHLKRIAVVVVSLLICIIGGWFVGAITWRLAHPPIPTESDRSESLRLSSRVVELEGELAASRRYAALLEGLIGPKDRPATTETLRTHSRTPRPCLEKITP